MAVNKNFVVKNGLEVSTDLIIADSTNNRVGVGTTVPEFTLEVNGGIGATDVKVSGFSTLTDGIHAGIGGTVFSVVSGVGVGASVGVGTAIPRFLLDVSSIDKTSTGTTALYVQGDARITGDLNLDDIIIDDATIQDLKVTKNVILNSSSGITTISGSVGLSSNLNVVGIVTASSFSGSGQIGVSSGGTLIGSAATAIDFTATNSTITATATSSGISTVNITPAVSIGLVLALGG